MLDLFGSLAPDQLPRDRAPYIPKSIQIGNEF